MAERQKDPSETSGSPSNRVDDVDKALWFPAIVTEATRRGCPHPLMTFCDQLPVDRKQQVEHKLEAILYEEINRLTDDQITNIKQTIKFTPHYFEVEICFWVGGYGSLKYSFLTYSTLRESILRWLSNYPWLTIDYNDSGETLDTLHDYPWGKNLLWSFTFYLMRDKRTIATLDIEYHNDKTFSLDELLNMRIDSSIDVDLNRADFESK